MVNDNRESGKEAWEILGELKANTAAEVKAQRSAARITIRSAIKVVPASISQRVGGAVEGITGDVSSGGSQALLGTPLLVGDVYLINFDREVLDTPPVFARCLRCRLIRDDAFEVGFVFFTPLDLETLLPQAAPEALV